MSKLLQAHDLEFARSQSVAHPAHSRSNEAGAGIAQDIDHHLSNRWVAETSGQQQRPKITGLDLLKNKIDNFCPNDVQDGYSRYEKVLMDSKGQPILIPLRRGNKHAAFIDQISFSIHQDTLTFETGGHNWSEEQYMVELSIVLQYVFGFGISEKLPHSGGRFYKSCYRMGSESIMYGRVHVGSAKGTQADTILIELTATGCQAASDDWEKRLFEFLAYATRPKITRVDLALDFFNQEYSPEQAYEDWQNDKFTCHHMRPDGDRHGSDWDSNNGKGKTFYVGTRQSGKFARVYNKAAEQGDYSGLNHWTRFEVEFKAKGGYVLPLDVLVNSGQYFCGSYPVCEQFQDYQVKRMDTSLKRFDYSWEHMLKFAKQQVGRVVNAIKFYRPDWSDAEVLEVFTPDHKHLPKRLDIAAYDAAASIIPVRQEFRPSFALDRYITSIFPDTSFNPLDNFAADERQKLELYFLGA